MNFILAYMILTLLLVAAFVQDAVQTKIANLLTIPAMLAGVLIAALAGDNNGVTGLWDSLLGLALGFTCMFILYALGAVGAGDVKLFGAIGSLTGAQFVMYGMMNSIVCAGIVGLVIVICRREMTLRMSNVFAVLFGMWIWRSFSPMRSSRIKESLKFPFMYAVLPAIGITWLTIGF